MDEGFTEVAKTLELPAKVPFMKPNVKRLWKAGTGCLLGGSNRRVARRHPEAPDSSLLKKAWAPLKSLPPRRRIGCQIAEPSCDSDEAYDGDDKHATVFPCSR